MRHRPTIQTTKAKTDEDQDYDPGADLRRPDPRKAASKSAASTNSTPKSNIRAKKEFIRPLKDQTEEGEPQDTQDALPWTGASIVPAQLPTKADGNTRKPNSTDAISKQLSESKVLGRSSADEGSKRVPVGDQQHAASVVRSGDNLPSMADPDDV